MKIKEWSVRGYKSIQDEHSVELGDVNILIGKNNSGKSSIVDSLNFYADVFPHGESRDGVAVSKHTTGKSPTKSIDFDLTFEFTDSELEALWEKIAEDIPFADGKLEKLVERGDLKKINHKLTVSEKDEECTSHFRAPIDDKMVPIRLDADGYTEYLNFNKLPELDYTDTNKGFLKVWNFIESRMNRWRTTSAFRDPASRLDVRRSEELTKDGYNLTQVLLTLQGTPENHFEQVEEIYKDVMPGVDGLRMAIKEDGKTTVVVDEKEFERGFELSEISSGSKEILTLITQIVLSQENTDLLLIEEPELHLHPGAEKKIYEHIEDILESDGPQIIISTHSNVFVNESDIGNIVRVRRDGHTTLEHVDEEKIASELTALGYEKSGLLHADAVVFTEGRSDKSILKNVATNAYDFDLGTHDITCVELESRSEMKTHSRSLVKLLDSFDIEYLFIADSDDDEVGDMYVEFKNKINCEGEDEEREEIYWDKATNENLHFWKEDEIEDYFFNHPAAISGALGLGGADEADELIERHMDEDEDADDVLEAMYAEKKCIDEDVNAYNKLHDGENIAKRIELQNLDNEWDKVFDKIGRLIGKPDLGSDKREELETDD